MKRRLAILLTGAMLAALASVLPATPAAASSQGVCAGLGSASTGPLFYPLTTNLQFQPAANTGFGFNLDVGACTDKPGGLQANGIVTGWCGLSGGHGSSTNGHAFHFIGIGPTLVITGQINGAVAIMFDATTGQDCDLGATRFLIAGGALKTECGVGVDPHFSGTFPTPGVEPHVATYCV